MPTTTPPCSGLPDFRLDIPCGCGRGPSASRRSIVSERPDCWRLMMASRLGPDDLLALEYVRAACLSPDGRSIAYCVSHTDDSEYFTIWISKLDTGDQRRLPYAGAANLPSWSKDGKFIAFVGDGRLRIADA